MSNFYGAYSDEQSITVLNRDTADCYCLGGDERLLGEFSAREGKCDNLFLCIKFGILRNEAGDFTGSNGKPEYVREACEASLKRLGVDTIDLHYMHRKIRYIGLPEMTTDELRRAHKVNLITAVQVEYSPLTLNIETDGVLATSRELSVSIVWYSPLGRECLTGAIKSSE
ncbi:NADP-dependent oxidoreductase domain-containing protein [Fennellomyces sp. T-0311]|nr:NADP-dependent oxidoreductase domain-containing protein [Fennellomyces sp. T-0311]